MEASARIIYAGEQEALPRTCKPWYVILALVPPPACTVKPEPFQLASPLVNLVNFLSELGSLSFGHEQLPCSQKGTAHGPDQAVEGRGGRSLQTVQGLFLGKLPLEEVTDRSKFPTPLPPLFFKLTAAQKKHVNQHVNPVSARQNNHNRRTL